MNLKILTALLPNVNLKNLDQYGIAWRKQQLPQLILRTQTSIHLPLWSKMDECII